MIISAGLLYQFCEFRDRRRYLNVPNTIGEFTYATDGRILIRVPALPDIGQHSSLPKSMREGFEKVLVVATDYTPLLLPPAPEFTNCIWCDGSGDCEDESIELCSSCDGTGLQNERPVSLGVSCVDWRYLALIDCLPNAEVAMPVAVDVGIAFRFEGGLGTLMPLKS